MQVSAGEWRVDGGTLRMWIETDGFTRWGALRAAIAQPMLRGLGEALYWLRQEQFQGNSNA